MDEVIDACGLLCVVINTMLYYIIKETFQTFIIKTKTCVINFDEIHRNIFVLLGCIVVFFYVFCTYCTYFPFLY
jgi:hypothetical protein